MPRSRRSAPSEHQLKTGSRFRLHKREPRPGDLVLITSEGKEQIGLFSHYRIDAPSGPLDPNACQIKGVVESQK